MIYIIYPEIVQRTFGKPELGVFHTDVNKIGYKDIHCADSIFELKDGKTKYYKNRHAAPPAGYQYTEEEKIMIALKAVPL